MPDLVTHTTIGYLVRNRKWDKYVLLLFMIGTALPDVLSRTFGIIFPAAAWFFHAFHTPVVMILFILLISLLFDDSLRWKVFKYLLYGTGFHCLLDLFQTGISDIAYLWFFPFTSTYDFQIRLFWAEDSMQFVPLFIVMFFISYKWENKIITFIKNKLIVTNQPKNHT